MCSMKSKHLFAVLSGGIICLAPSLAHAQAESAPQNQIQADTLGKPADKKTEMDEQQVLKMLEKAGLYRPVTGEKQAQQNPLLQVSRQMKVVVDDLGKLSTGDPTQQKQKRIVSELDQLIAMLEKECEACRGGGRGTNNPNKPLNDSRIVKGPGGIGDLHAPRPDGKNWGDLPARERARILQATDDGFPVHYQRILERYYRRVAEEQSTNAPKTGETQP